MSMMNRLANCHNQYQGNTKKVLCVCSAGLLRSPTAANTLYEKFGFNTRAAGCVTEYALIPVDDVLIEWADEIVFMEESHYKVVASNFDLSTVRADLIVLDIPDKYSYNAPKLKEEIENQYEDKARELSIGY